MTRRARHFLMGRIAAEHHAKTGALPPSRTVALIAAVHPSTARRWLADLRIVMPQKVSALRSRA